MVLEARAADALAQLKAGRPIVDSGDKTPAGPLKAAGVDTVVEEDVLKAGTGDRGGAKERTDASKRARSSPSTAEATGDGGDASATFQTVSALG